MEEIFRGICRMRFVASRGSTELVEVREADDCWPWDSSGLRPMLRKKSGVW